MSFSIYNVISLKKKWYAKQLIFEKKKLIIRVPFCPSVKNISFKNNFALDYGEW